MFRGTAAEGRSEVHAWDAEYERQGIPSSHRDEPSGVLSWALDNIRHVARRPVERALDLGCGTGRNAMALAATGIHVTAMDFSPAALELAASRPGAELIDFIQGDVTDALPMPTGSCDLVTDIFVYFHQLSDSQRASYRSEIRRVLAPGGVVLLSLATAEDEYYAGCPSLDTGELTSVSLKWDPVAEVGNILPTEEEIVRELSADFEVVMTWRKHKHGVMHGEEFMRHTLGLILR